MATLVSQNMPHNLVNVGILDACHLQLENICQALSRQGLVQELNEAIRFRDSLFKSKMDLRHATNL